jgi:hypothetical protein
MPKPMTVTMGTAASLPRGCTWAHSGLDFVALSALKWRALFCRRRSRTPITAFLPFFLVP